MKESKISINCSLCGHLVAETTEADVNMIDLAAANKLQRIKINDKEGYICQGCSDLLTIDDTLKKIVKEALDFGNSSHVILPKKWTGKRIMAFKLE